MLANALLLLQFLPSRHARDPARAKRISPERSATSPPPLSCGAPCDGEKNRHARESTWDATRRRLKGPKRPGSLASSGSRSSRLRMGRGGQTLKLSGFRSGERGCHAQACANASANALELPLRLSKLQDSAQAQLVRPNIRPNL